MSAYSRPMLQTFMPLWPHARFLAFGFLLSFWSGFGQTYFIALFGGLIRTQFDLSAAEFGTLYSIATLGGAAALIYLGRLIDRTDLRSYAIAVAFALAAGCAILWQATSPALLLLALFSLRLAGQGLMTHTALTAMGRYFDEARGKAVSLATIGHPAGEALWPTVIVLCIGLFGWQASWGLFALGTAVCLPPVILWLLKGHQARHEAYVARTALIEEVSLKGRGAPIARLQLKATDRVWRLLPALMALPFIITGLFFHQSEVIAQKGWTLELVARAFAGYAVAAMIAMALAGPLIDRITAVRACRLGLLPMIAAAGALILIPGANGAFVYLFLAGLAAGLMSTIGGTIWPELYGTAKLGAVRAFSHAGMVFFSALGPVAMGVAVDAGFSIDVIASACICYMFFAGALCFTVSPDLLVKDAADTAPDR